MSKQKKRKPANRDPRNYALTQASYWLKKCYDVGITAGEAVAHSVTNHNVTNHKENEGEKRTSPLGPPIEKRAKQEKIPPTRAHACEAFCEAFWARYPKGHKTNRKLCFEKLRSRYMAKKDGAEAFAAKVLAGLDKWLACERWQLGIIVKPETFINQKRWNDEPPPPDPPRRGVSQTANVLSKEAIGLW